MAPADWDTSCLDWRERLREGRSLVPALPLFRDEAERAVGIYNLLTLPDVPGTPRLSDAGGEWFRNFMRALFGSYDAATGRRLIREAFILVPKKNSKALALDTLVATPTGFSTIGELEVGDEVFDCDGRPTIVTAKSEVFVRHDCYKVTFSTGESFIADAGHRWVTDAHTDRQGARKGSGRLTRNAAAKVARPSVKTTEQIAATLRVKSGGLVVNNHRTALAGILDLPDADLPMHPYALGLWLGDGTSSSTGFTCSSSDAPHYARELADRGCVFRVLGRHASGGAVRADLGDGSRRTGGLRSRLAALGVLGDKHIPAAYLRASAYQRLELLRGLMDTDGHVSASGDAVYTGMNERLVRDVAELVATLGMKPAITSSVARLRGRATGIAWRVQFIPHAELSVCTLPRKVARQHARHRKAVMGQRSRFRQIVSCERVESVPVQCISVASGTHQFLIGRSMIPTHNTTNGAALMLAAVFTSKRPRAEFLFVAPTQEISNIAFAQAVGMVEADETLRKKCHIQDHLKRIVYRPTGAFLKVKSFDPKVLTGSKPSGVLLDELHVIAEAPNADRVIGQLRGGLISQPEGFLVTITTQSERPPAGVFKAELTKARAVRDGKLKAPILPVLYEFPNRDEWRDVANWPMVLPNLGKSITLERLVEEKAAAESAGPAELARWASQHLNVEIGIALSTDNWAGGEFWIVNGHGPRSLEEIIERCDVLTVGIDGGGLDDLLGLCVIGREEGTGDWLAWHRAYCHPIALKRRQSEEARYRDFAADGDLIICDAVGDDVFDVVDIVSECEASGKLDKIGVDPAGIGSIVDAIEAAGIVRERIVGIPQGWRLAGAIKTTERRLAAGTLLHGGLPMMEWCVGNAKVEQRANSVLISKAVSGTAKIDPVCAMFNAVALLSIANAPFNVGALVS